MTDLYPCPKLRVERLLSNTMENSFFPCACNRNLTKACSDKEKCTNKSLQPWFQSDSRELNSQELFTSFQCFTSLLRILGASLMPSLKRILWKASVDFARKEFNSKTFKNHISDIKVLGADSEHIFKQCKKIYIQRNDTVNIISN